MGASIRVGKILGVPVSLHFSWFIVLVLFTLVFEGHFDRVRLSWSAEERWLVALATSLLMFLSVLAHELSHSLVAVQRGIPVKGITLFVLGGVSQIAKEAQRPSTEFVIAIVGPLTSFALGLGFLGISIGLEGTSGHLSELAWTLGFINITLGIFNMLPGFPLDGGRVLRAVVWRVTRDYWRATRLSAFGGQVLALLMIGGGIAVVIAEDSGWMQGMWLVMLGIFLYSVAAGSHRQTRVMKQLWNLTARDVMDPSPRTEPESITLTQLMGGPPGDGLVLLTRWGLVRGLVTRQMIKKVPRSRWHLQTAGSIVIPLERVPAVDPEEIAYRVVELMEERNVSYALVMDKDRALGSITSVSLRNYEKSLERRKPKTAS